MNPRANELRQYLFPVGCGPSEKTWPRCEPHLAQSTSVLGTLRELSVFVLIASFLIGWKKLGQPVPESNFVLDEKSGAEQAAHL